MTKFAVKIHSNFCQMVKADQEKAIKKSKINQLKPKTMWRLEGGSGGGRMGQEENNRKK